MSGEERERRGAGVSNVTHIGSVTGQQHSGSGDIMVRNFDVHGVISNREEFLAALRAFRIELEAAHERGMTTDEALDDVAVEVEAAEREAGKDHPKTERIVKRLENAKAVLTASTAVAAAIGEAAEPTSKLMGLVQSLIDTAGSLFG